jgi:sugar phosphate permease
LPDNEQDSKVQVRQHAIFALVLFSFLNLINQIDRRALVTIFPLLKLEWGLSDAQLGLAVSLFTIGRTLSSLPAGWLADRKGIIQVLRPMVLLWSLLTIASGWAGRFFTFITLRMGVGLMDGANGPLDLAYLGRVSPKNRRGTFFAIYSIALYLGSGLGVIYAGAIGERFGWRVVFIIPGILGLLATIGLFLLPKDPTMKTEVETSSVEKFRRSDYYWLIKQPLPGIFVGGALGVFASTALVSWLPTYLTRQYSLSLIQAGLITGGIIIPASMVGTLMGGFLSDRFGKWYPKLRFQISAAGLGLAMVFGLAGLWSTSVAGTISFFLLTAISFTLPVSPLIVMVQEAVHKQELATTQAAFGLSTQILGAAPATGLVGLISDQLGLQMALVLPFLAVGMGAFVIILTSKVKQETESKL